MRTVLFNRLFLLTAVLLTSIFTSSAFGQCGSCSCYPGYTYTNTSVDYDGESVVATGVTSGAYSSCGHTYGVTVQITSPDGRHISYETGFGGSNYASGSAWMSFGGYDGDYFALTYHKERCWISGAIFVSAVTQLTSKVAPTVKFISLNWSPNETISSQQSSTLKATFTATLGAVGAKIAFETPPGSTSGSLNAVNYTPPAGVVTGEHSLIWGNNNINTVMVTDASTQANTATWNNGNINLNFAWTGDENSIQGVKIEYQGGRIGIQSKTLTVKSF